MNLMLHSAQYESSNWHQKVFTEDRYGRARNYFHIDFKSIAMTMSLLQLLP